MTDLTAPQVAHTLAEKVALVERFQPVEPDWAIIVNRAAPDWVLRWDRITLLVGERSDLELARFIALERIRGRQAIDRIVVENRTALGWGRGEPRVRCIVCRVSDVASQQHRPGSPECDDTREDRRLAHND